MDADPPTVTAEQIDGLREAAQSQELIFVPALEATIIALLDEREALKAERDEAQTNLGIATATMVAQEAALRASEAEREKWHGNYLDASRNNALLRSREIALEAERERMRVALEKILRLYVTLASSGDCGHWNPEEEPDVILARATLTKEPEDVDVRLREI